MRFYAAAFLLQRIEADGRNGLGKDWTSVYFYPAPKRAPPRGPGAWQRESPISNLEALDAAPVVNTRRALKKERTRREIYRTAMHLFGERDYDGVTIEDICSGAGVAKATFFLHFESKAALLQEFNDEVTRSLAEQLSGHDGTAEEQLLFLLDAFLEAYERNAPVMRKMLREFIDQPTVLARAATVNESVIDIVTDIVRGGQDRSELRGEMPPELAAVAIVSTWSTIAAFSAEHPETDAGLASRQIIDIMLNGMKKT